MKHDMNLFHEFVEYTPSNHEDSTIYISVKFATAVHKCCCGCGNEVVTPLSPTDWQLIFDGISISLYPSIGNWGFKCKSHYWIRYDRIIWAPQWSQKEINKGRVLNQYSKESYFKTTKSITNRIKKKSSERLIRDKIGWDFWHKIKKLWTVWYIK